jgi:hypothetical protein
MRKFATLLCFMLSIFANTQTAQSAATVIVCKFEHMPTMKLTLRGGMGANDNTLKVGKAKPVKLNVGSSLMIASYGAQELVFSLRLPQSVTVSAPDNDTLTYFGECN